MKLSQVKLTNCFIFEPGQKPRYVCDKNSSYAELDSTEGLVFVVTQVNKKSVKCRIKYGRIEYVFKFAGVFNNYVPCTDYDILLLEHGE